MPLPNLKSRPGRILCALAASAAIALAAPALATACTLDSSPGNQVFARFGDSNYYTLARNGTFSNWTSGWSLNNAWLTWGGPGLVPGDGRALAIGPGGSATTPSFCIGNSTPSVRLMAREPGTYGTTTMQAWALWSDWAGQPHRTYIAWTPGTFGWEPTTSFLVDSLPLWEPGSTLTIRLQLVPQDFGTWMIDDVFVDPYNRG